VLDSRTSGPSRRSRTASGRDPTCSNVLAVSV